MTEAEQVQTAAELDARVKALRFTGRDGPALFVAMSDRMADFKTLMDAAPPDAMGRLLARFPDLRHYVELLTGIAGGIRDGKIKPPR